MALSGNFLRRILGGGLVSRSIECRRSFLRLASALTSPKLFIHVSPSITDEKIREAFAPFGNLRSAKVIKNKALAIVTYDTIQEAETARKRMHFRRFGGFVLFIESESEFLNPNYEYPQSGC